VERTKEIEERLKNIAHLMNSSSSFIDELDIAIPSFARKMIEEIFHSEEIKSIIDDIEQRRAPRIVLVGRSGVGKSSLINAMFDTYLAETSSIEVGTIEHEIFKYKKQGKTMFEVIDTRGIKENISEQSRTAEEDLRTVIEDFQPDAFMFLTSGADRSTLREDTIALKELMDHLNVKPPLLTVINRIDEIEPSRIKIAEEYTDRKLKNIEDKVKQVKQVLDDASLKDAIIVPVSSYVEWSDDSPEDLSAEEREKLRIVYDGRYNIDELINVLVDHIEFRAALDLMLNNKVENALEKIANVFVKRFTAASAVVGTTPIPIADILVLLPIQVIEVMLIAYLSGNEVSAKTAREFIISLGAVFLFGFGLRFVAQQGSKLLNVVPGAGSAISGGVAASGTYSIGKAAIAYYMKEASMDEVKQVAESSKEEMVAEEEIVAEEKDLKETLKEDLRTIDEADEPTEEKKESILQKFRSKIRLRKKK